MCMIYVKFDVVNEKRICQPIEFSTRSFEIAFIFVFVLDSHREICQTRTHASTQT